MNSTITVMEEKDLFVLSLQKELNPLCLEYRHQRGSIISALIVPQVIHGELICRITSYKF